MTITATHDLNTLKNEYVQATKGKNTDDIRVRLTYAQPTELFYSKYRRDNVTQTIHEVKRLFFLKDGVANCMHEEGTTPSGAYYIAGKNRARGFELPRYGLVSVEIMDAPEEDHREAWGKIAESMRTYGINLDAAAAIEKGTRGESDCTSEYCKQSNKSPYHTHFCQNYWDMKKDKPRVANFKDLSQGRSIEFLKTLARPTEYSEKGHATYHESRNGVKRDRSITLTTDDKGRVSYTAASEYAGCGNGDYYLMYSLTMAFYTETD